MGDLEGRVGELEARIKDLEDAAVVPETDKMFLSLHPEERQNFRQITEVVIERIAQQFLKERCPGLHEKRLQNEEKVPALQYVEKLTPSQRRDFEDFLDRVVKGLINAHKN